MRIMSNNIYIYCIIYNIPAIIPPLPLELLFQFSARACATTGLTGERLVSKGRGGIIAGLCKKNCSNTGT